MKQMEIVNKWSRDKIDSSLLVIWEWSDMAQEINALPSFVDI